MNTHWNKVGAAAALFEAVAYLVGFGFVLGVLQPAFGNNATTLHKLGVILSMAGWFQAWNAVIYILFGAVLVALVIALHDVLAGGAALLMKTASSFGLIWSGMVIATGTISNIGLAVVQSIYVENAQQAVLAWQVLGAVQDGLGGGVEFVGGIWITLVSVSALQTQAFPRMLNYLGLATGLAGVLTLISPLKELGAVFGIGQIAWFIGLGAVLLRLPGKARGAHETA